MRQICCDTADAEKPVENFFPDREVFADLLTDYYTEFEPQSTFVADNGGEVVGYTTGCPDTKHFLHIMKRRIVPMIFFKALLRARFGIRRRFGSSVPILALWLKGVTPGWPKA